MHSGSHAETRFWEFFTVTVRNRNTRAAYARAAAEFFDFLRGRGGVARLLDIQPMHVAAYVEELGKSRSAPTVKLRLAALRSLFDWLVVGQVIPSNPAAAVRGPKHAVRKGRTPVLAPGEARILIRHVDAETLVGKRDRALIGVMLYGLARVSAAVGMRVADVNLRGHQHWLRLREKGGKVHELPAHHLLEDWLLEYISAAGIARESKAPLFRAAVGRSGTLSHRPLLARNALHMIRRRVADAEMETPIGCHSLRATGITAYLANGGALETAQRMAGHASPRTTQLYDRTDDAVTLDEIERIIL